MTDVVVQSWFFSVCGCVCVELSIMSDTLSTNPDKKETMKAANQTQDQQRQVLGHQHQPLTSLSQNLPNWEVDSDEFSDDLGDLNIEGEDLTLQHVPIAEWGCSLTD